MEDLFYIIYLAPMKTDLGVTGVNKAITLFIERFFIRARRNSRYFDPSSSCPDDEFEVPVRYIYQSVDIYRTALGILDLKSVMDLKSSSLNGSGLGLKVPDLWARLVDCWSPAVSFMCFGLFGPFREVSPFSASDTLPGPHPLAFPFPVCLRNSGSSLLFGFRLSLGFEGVWSVGRREGNTKKPIQSLPRVSKNR